MKLRITTDLDGDELVKALASTAIAHGVDDQLRQVLNKANTKPQKPQWMSWESRLRELSRDTTSESEWANPKLQRTENSMVKYASTFALAWIKEIRPLIRRLLEHPSEVEYEDFLRHTDYPILDIVSLTELLSDALDIARNEFNRMNNMPSRGEWVEVPEPIYQDRVFKRSIAAWIARQSAASKMREWAEGMREDVRWQVVQAIRDGITAEELEQRLNQRWDNYGQHFRTIAATELAMAYNDASLVLMAGKHVVIPPIGDEKVCKECKYWLEGKVFYVSPVPIENPTKQQLEQYLWPGKSNVGRKQEDWVPCLPLHPNCRHVPVLYRGGDPRDYKG